MARSLLTIVVLSTFLLVPASGPLHPAAVAGAATPPVGGNMAVEAVTPAVPACTFGVGDVVTRWGIGATVPERGEAVGGFADGPSGGAEIMITTSAAGLVTIDPGGEACQLLS